MRLAQLGRPRHHARVLGEGAQQVALALGGQLARVERVDVDQHPEVGGVAHDAREPRVGVLDVVDRVVVALARHLGDVERERRVDRVADQRVAQRVDADEVDQLAQRDHGAGALGELQLLAVLHDLDELADEHLELLAGGVADAGGHRREPADVAVVVGAEQVDARVEAPLALVDVVGGVGREVGELAVGADEHPVLVVAEVGGAHPGGAVLLVRRGPAPAAWRTRARWRRTRAASARRTRRRSACASPRARLAARRAGSGSRRHGTCRSARRPAARARSGPARRPGRRAR